MSKNIHKCHICGKNPADSKEHIPPKSVWNIGGVKLKHLYIDKTNNRLRHIETKSHDGFFVKTICNDCNKRNGHLYVDYFKDFYFQIKDSPEITSVEDNLLISLKNVYPLRVLKQIFSMFLSIVPYEPTHKWDSIQEFVLNKDVNIPINTPRIFIYNNISKNKGRIVPFCAIGYYSIFKPIDISEISFPYLGIVYSFDKSDIFRKFEEITYWGNYDIEDNVNIVLNLPRLETDTKYPLIYGSEKKIKELRIADKLIWLLHIPDNSVVLSDLSVLLIT